MKHIKVTEPYQVVLGGTVFGPGEIAEVPAELADEWVRNGWATIQPARPPVKAKARPTVRAKAT